MEPNLSGTPYRLGSLLGYGSFSKVFAATDVSTGKSVAVKWTETPRGASLLEKEAGILRDLKHCKAVPRLLAASSTHRYLVMKRVGKTLLELRTTLGGLSLQTLCLIGTRCISALEEIHSCGYVHRDIKPDNLTASPNKSSSRLYLIDFGLSTKYVSKGLHVKYSETEGFQGSPFFCSLNTLRGVKCTRRDDVEAVGYVLLYLKKGALPWMGRGECTVNELMRIRERITVRQLCEGENPMFVEYFRYCQGLKFEERPNYAYLRSLVSQIAKGLSLDLTYVPEWSSSKSKRRRSACHPCRTTDSIPVVPSRARHPSPVKTAITLQSIASVPNNDDSGVVTPKVAIHKLPSIPWPRKGKFSLLLKSA